MSPLTYWHYILIGVITFISLLTTIVAFRSDSKWSIFLSVNLILALIMFFVWELINQSVYQVEVSQVEDKHLYQTEQLMIKGVVRNTGEFPVANVIGVIKLINSNHGKDKKRQQFNQPTAFAEVYKGDNPGSKPQNIISEHVLVDYLNPGSSKSFVIYLDYPPYFSNGYYEINGKVY